MVLDCFAARFLTPAWQPTASIIKRRVAPNLCLMGRVTKMGAVAVLPAFSALSNLVYNLRPVSWEEAPLRLIVLVVVPVVQVVPRPLLPDLLLLSSSVSVAWPAPLSSCSFPLKSGEEIVKIASL